MAQKTISMDASKSALQPPSTLVQWLGIASAVIILLGGITLQTLAGYSADDNSGHAWGSDDAWISYQYARNLAEGRGLVFNTADRVEGYSNLLYVVLISTGFLFTDGLGIYIYSVVLNTIFMIAALIIFYGYVRERFGEWIGLIGAILFALLPPIWVWTAAGLETPLALMLQIAIWVSVERIAHDKETRSRLVLIGVLAGLSVLTRADGFITPIIAAVFLAIKGHRRAAIVIGGAALITLIAQVAFRISYYGYPLPNTYYVKVSGSLFARVKAAMKQLILHMPRYGLLPYTLIILVGMLATIIDLSRDWRTSLTKLRFDVFLAAGWLGYFLYSGGDTFDERFLLILMCLGFMILFELGQRIRSIRDLAMIGVPIFLLYQGVVLIADPRYDFRPQKYDRWITLGEFLHEEYPDAVLAIDGAGKVPYFSGLETIDMLGLNNTYIAHQPAIEFVNPGHNKHDADYVFSRKPDVIAAWLLPYSLDFAWDLTQDRYISEGYELKYLVNSSAEANANNILDATNLTADEIKRLTVNGYEYGLLIRIK